MSEWNKDYADPRAIEQTFLLDTDAFSKMVARFPVIEDDHPYTEFPLWRLMFDKENPPGDFTAQAIRDALAPRKQ